VGATDRLAAKNGSNPHGGAEKGEEYRNWVPIALSKKKTGGRKGSLQHRVELLPGLQNEDGGKKIDERLMEKADVSFNDRTPADRRSGGRSSTESVGGGGRTPSRRRVTKNTVR